MELDSVLKILTFISVSFPILAVIKYAGKKQRKDIFEILDKLDNSVNSSKKHLLNSEIFSIYFDINAPISHINSILENNDPIRVINLYKKFSFLMKFEGKIQKSDNYIKKWNTQRDFCYFFAVLIISFWILIFSKTFFIYDKTEQILVNILFIIFSIGIYIPFLRLTDTIFDLNQLDKFFADQE